MSKKKGVILLLISSLIWGTAYIPTRYLGTQNVGVFFELLVRYAFPMVIFAIIAFKDIRKTSKTDMKKYMLTGLMLFLALTLAVYGVRAITYGSMGLLLISLNTIFVPLYLVVAKKQKIAKMLIAASILSMCGAVLLTLNSDLKIKIELGFVLCILASVCFSAYIILCSKVLKGTDTKPAVLQFFQSLVFVALCSILVFRDMDALRAINFSPNVYLALAFIGILTGTVAYYLYFYAMKITDPTTTGVILDSQIIISVVSEVIISRISLSTTQIVAYLMVISAILLASYSSNKKS